MSDKWWVTKIEWWKKKTKQGLSLLHCLFSSYWNIFNSFQDWTRTAKRCDAAAWWWRRWWWESKPRGDTWIPSFYIDMNGLDSPHFLQLWECVICLPFLVNDLSIAILPLDWYTALLSFFLFKFIWVFYYEVELMFYYLISLLKYYMLKFILVFVYEAVGFYCMSGFK